MRTHPKLLSAVMLSIALLGAACSSSNTATTDTAAPAGTTGGGAGTTAAPKATGTITVSAATSLTTPFGTIGDAFEQANPGVDVKFNFDSSGTLATQIQTGAPADTFASADDANMKKLTDASLIAGKPVQFARNKLTIVVKKGNPRNIKAVADLATAGTISLCGTDAPCGKYADQILATAKVTIPTDAVTRGQNVKTTLSAVSDGDADAAIVYVTDVTDVTGDKVEKVVIPDEINVIASYPIGTVKASTNRATSQAFIDYVLGPAGQGVLTQAGFLPPA